MSTHPDFVIGALALVGMPGISHPGDWRFVRILWFDGCEVLVRETGTGGPDFNNLLSNDHIRAVGDHAYLREFRDTSAKAVAEQRAIVKCLEEDLHRARDVLWAKLDEIGATRLGIETHAAKGARRRRAARRKIGLEEAV